MQAIPASFRDPAGFVFRHDGQYYRTVHASYAGNYNQLMDGGLYAKLVDRKWMVSHVETGHGPSLRGKNENVFRILHPQQIPFITYAWEWSFSMLQDAALLTLDIALEAIAHQMMLKDANTFNMQFVDGKPILIDTLSFEAYREEEPWIAYRQFCEHFLAPLLLMKYTDTGLHQLQVAWPNGIPLEICRKLLPARARWNLHVNLHIFLQSKLSAKATSASENKQQFSRTKMLNLLRGLRDFVQGLHPRKHKTTWDNYYDETILSTNYLDAKKTLVKNMLANRSFETLLDLGANEGEFSRIMLKQAKHIIALDQDANCIEALYQHCRKASITQITPLICDLTNPSPSLGWNNEERPALFKRINADITFALALIHHLAIAANLPLEKILAFLHSLGPYVLLEFVDKQDPKVQQLLSNRKDIFTAYSIEHLRQLLPDFFTIEKEEKIPGVERTLFLLKRI